MESLKIDLDRALAFRLARHHLIEPAAGPLEAARSLIGAQAQVHSAGVLQLRARSAAWPADGVDGHLYGDRSLVKLWAQRGTLHMTATDDLGLVLAMRRLQVGSYHSWYASEGLSPEQVETLVGAVADAVAAGPHSRMDLSRRLVPVLGEWARPMLEHSWGGIIKLACALGHVCHGPARDGGEGEREALFVHLPGWAALPPAPEPRAAMAALLRRYLAVYGPAGQADFRKFTGLYAAPARQAFEDLAEELVPVDLEGRAAFVLARDEEALRTAEPPPGHVAVLPLFDPWLLAHADSAQTVQPRHRPAVYRTAGWISAVVLRQGRVVATWSHRRRAAGWEVELTPLVRVTKAER
ncbi:MAG TPA: crosslink repair DNA glycosylase YcaQ family protein, partial [Azospirillaceae bacterium]|nr:crosslink repair DNA glycosylase YcaQ family protein [Azospirillaceae bacterium]